MAFELLNESPEPVARAHRTLAPRQEVRPDAVIRPLTPFDAPESELAASPQRGETASTNDLPKPPCGAPRILRARRRRDQWAAAPIPQEASAIAPPRAPPRPCRPNRAIARRNVAGDRGIPKRGLAMAERVRAADEVIAGADLAQRVERDILLRDGHAFDRKDKCLSSALAG